MSSPQAPAQSQEAPGGAPSEAASPHRINLSWLLRLRWAAIVGETVTIAVVDRLMGIPLPLLPLLGLVAVQAASNVACTLWLSRTSRVDESALAAVMSADVALFTGLLYFSGGPFNPFSFLYLVYIALAALVLSPPWTWTLVLLALACNAALFFHHVPLAVEHGGHDSHAHHGGHGEPLNLHLRGMWVAFGVAAAFIVYFLHRVNRSLAQREAELRESREQQARHERLASVATLAAGAAHELGTPLATIAVVARELERACNLEAVGEDARLIREQVERCRHILGQLSEDAGATAGEMAVAVEAQVLVDASLEGVAGRDRVRLEWDGSAREAGTLVIPLRAVAQALRVVVKNALDASAPGAEVVLSVHATKERFTFTVRDFGVGMPPEVRARAGEPFFTTKDPGQGMGLGLFLARGVVDLLGGRLDFESQEGQGTRVELILPRAVEATNHRIAVGGVGGPA